MVENLMCQNDLKSSLLFNDGHQGVSDVAWRKKISIREEPLQIMSTLLDIDRNPTIHELAIQ